MTETLQLTGTITKEEFDMIAGVDFDRTESVTFHTKNGKDVEFVKRRIGHWIMHCDDLFPEESTMECSECGEHQPIFIDDNFCPNCGAEMKTERKRG